MRKAAHTVLAFLCTWPALPLQSCSSADSSLEEREPRSSSEEGFVLRARERTPDPAEVTPQPLRPRRRPKGTLQEVFGEQSAVLVLPKLEGVWRVRALEVPSSVARSGDLSGYAVISGDHLQYFVLIEGTDLGFDKRYVLFQTGGYSLVPDTSGLVRMVSLGGYTNLTRDLSKLPLDRPVEGPGEGEQGSELEPLPSEEYRQYRVPDLRRMRFFDRDLLRIEKDPQHYLELQRIATNRILKERYGEQSRGLPIDPTGQSSLEALESGSREELMSPRVLKHRKEKRDLAGVWQVLEVHHPLRTPGECEGTGFLVFLDGYALYQITFSQVGLLGRLETLFQVGVRRYALTTQGELILEDIIGITNLVQRRMSRIPAGTRRHLRVEFESEDRLVLRRGKDEFLVLARLNRPTFIERLRAEEQEAASQPEDRNR